VNAALTDARSPLTGADVLADLLGATLRHLSAVGAPELQGVLVGLLPDAYVLVKLLPRAGSGHGAGAGRMARVLDEGMVALDNESRSTVVGVLVARMREMISQTEVALRLVGWLACTREADIPTAHKTCYARSSRTARRSVA
jgi:hypothetical protein